MRVATTGEGELDVSAMKKYIQYCKAKCAPRLSEEAGEVLTSSYVKIRDDVRRQSIQASGVAGEDTQATIPITVRQLEALVRLSESLAKMRLDSDLILLLPRSRLPIEQRWNEPKPFCAVV
jgi:DNA replication licensing factor MCM5